MWPRQRYQAGLGFGKRQQGHRAGNGRYVSRHGLARLVVHPYAAAALQLQGERGRHGQHGHHYLRAVQDVVVKLRCQHFHLPALPGAGQRQLPARGLPATHRQPLPDHQAVADAGFYQHRARGRTAVQVHR